VRRLRDGRGAPIDLGSEFGGGGEGVVHAIVGRDDSVAKVYRAPLTDDRVRKLNRMVAGANPKILGIAAWPIDLLFDPNSGDPVGFLMRRVVGFQEIHQLYSPVQRKRLFPNADWRHLIRAARNCAAAFDTLHQEGIVVGDVNQGNLLVNESAEIRLIDCDSFQVTSAGQVHLCRVGVPHFQPPEFQSGGLDWTTVARTADHDNFGLAVLIFHLLLLGRHPFAGRYSGQEDLLIEEAIGKRLFAYGRSAVRNGMSPPPHTVPRDALSGEVMDAFESAFVTGGINGQNRPTSAQWVTLLDQLERRLTRCADGSSHYFVPRSAGCPWCELNLNGAPDFFEGTGSIGDGARTFDTARFWSEVEQVSRPDRTFVPAQRADPRHLRPRAIAVEGDSGSIVRLVLFGVAIGAVLVSALALIEPRLLFATFPIAVSSSAGALILQRSTPLGKARRRVREQLDSKVAECRGIELRMRRLASESLDRFDADRSALLRMRNQYDASFGHQRAEIDSLGANVRMRQLEAFLRTKLLYEHRIEGIGTSRLATLEAYGVETAFDVTPERLADVPGFGEVLRARLLDWRSRIESRFRFDPSQGVPRSELVLVERRYRQHRMVLERQMKKLLCELREGVRKSSAEISEMDRQAAELDREAKQLRCDLDAMPKFGWQL